MLFKDYLLGLILDNGKPTQKKAMAWITFFTVLGEFIYKNYQIKDMIQDMPTMAVTLILVLAGLTTFGPSKGTDAPKDS